MSCHFIIERVTLTQQIQSKCNLKQKYWNDLTLCLLLDYVIGTGLRRAFFMLRELVHL